MDSPANSSLYSIKRVLTFGCDMKDVSLGLMSINSKLPRNSAGRNEWGISSKLYKAAEILRLLFLHVGIQIDNLCKEEFKMVKDNLKRKIQTHLERNDLAEDKLRLLGVLEWIWTIEKPGKCSLKELSIWSIRRQLQFLHIPRKLERINPRLPRRIEEEILMSDAFAVPTFPWIEEKLSSNSIFMQRYA